MKSAVILTAVLLVGGFAGDAMAICNATTDTRLNLAGIRNALSGKRILATAPAGETWYEDHCAVSAAGAPAANLYKVGDGTAIDPRALRGTWEIGGSGNDRTVIYTYYKNPPSSTPGPNLVYTWSLWQRSDGTIDFCDGTTQIAVITTSAAAGAPCP